MSKIQKNSFVSISLTTPQGKNIHTIVLVDHVDKDYVYCIHAVTSVDYSEFRPTKELLKTHGCEELSKVSLINSEEFDIIFDLGIIPLNKFKNL